MNIAVRAPLPFVAFLAALAVLSGCATPHADRQIRERIASIREAILAERAAGIVEFGTPDWRFVSADDKAFDRAAYLQRVEKLFAGIEIESLETRVERVDERGARAEVELVQIMVRRETDAAGERARWKVRYRESQEWVKSATRGWLVARVKVYSSQREKLPLE